MEAGEVVRRREQQFQGGAASSQDAAKFARRVRRRLGLTQLEFSKRIGVSLDTIRIGHRRVRNRWPRSDAVRRLYGGRLEQPSAAQAGKSNRPA